MRSFVSKSRASISDEENVQGAPDLIVEILSPSTSKRDLGIKKTYMRSLVLQNIGL